MSPVLTLATAQLRADLRHSRSGRRGAGRIATTLIAYGFSGAVLALSLAGAPPDHALHVAASFAIVLSVFGVVGSYDELMGRPKDNAWLATLPATEREHFAARLLGIGAYVGLMAAGVAIPVGVGVALVDGAVLGAVVAGGVALAAVWTALAGLAALWGLTLSLPERALRLTLTVVRSVLIGALVLGFQTIGAAPEAVGASWWPGAWLADALGGGARGVVALAASGVVFGVLYGVVFPDQYFRLLRHLADGARRDGQRTRTGRSMTAPERWAVRSGPVRAAYGFATAAFADDRLVRGRLWPAALLPAGFVVFGWLSGGLGSVLGAAEMGVLEGTLSVLQDPDTQLHLSILVVLLFCVQSLVQTLQFSDHAEAAWVFATVPGARPRVVQLGAQKALAWRVLVPLHVLAAVLLTLSMPAAEAVALAALWLGVSVLVSRLLAMAYRTYPFSRRSDRFSASARFVPILVSIPAGLVAMVLQVWAFGSLPRAWATSAGLWAVAALVGEAVRRWPARRPRWAKPEAAPAAMTEAAGV